MQQTFWFPGRWLGGAALVAGPALLLLGALLRVQFYFFFPEQLAAYEANPALLKASYWTFLAGLLLMVPAVLALAHQIGQRRPALAICGGALAVIGLMKRAFDYGTNDIAFRLVDDMGAAAATQIVADSYSHLNYVAQAASAAGLAGWLVLAVGAFLSRALGLLPAIALGLAAGLELGMLKGTTSVSLVALAGLAVALVPLGVRLLADGAKPSARAVLTTIAATAGLTALFAFIGQAG